MEFSQAIDSRDEYLAILEKVESLLKTGVNNGLYNPYDLTEMKRQLKSIRSVQDMKNFKENGYVAELIELTRLCGRVCCVVVVKPNSPLQEYACRTCPIYKYEESFVD